MWTRLWIIRSLATEELALVTLDVTCVNRDWDCILG